MIIREVVPFHQPLVIMYINLVYLNVTLTSLSTSVMVWLLSIPVRSRAPTTASDSSELFRASYLVLKFYLFRVFKLALALTLLQRPSCRLHFVAPI